MSLGPRLCCGVEGPPPSQVHSAYSGHSRTGRPGPCPPSTPPARPPPRQTCTAWRCGPPPGGARETSRLEIIILNGLRRVGGDLLPMTGTCFSIGGLTRQSNTRPSSITTSSPLWTSSLSSQSSLSTSRMCLTPTNSRQDLIWDLSLPGSLVQMSDCQILGSYSGLAWVRSSPPTIPLMTEC